ncbi:hypothetical protein HK096_007231 [Nowakowskiella sp. JEL0078]|nr:hypothetical protein HK096_007231 [Nowakowskiella sp. JEL0078]
MDAFLNYDFDNDATFRLGIVSLLSKPVLNSDTSEVDYKNLFIDPNFIYNPENTRNLIVQISPNETYPKCEETNNETPINPLSFAEICEMVARGEKVPGIKQIPSQLAIGTPSIPSLPLFKKPWEK